MRNRSQSPESRFSARVLQAFSAAGLPVKFEVRAATADAPAEILLYDEIGPWGVTAKDFMSGLAGAGAGPINVRINSPGGDVFDGLAIYNALRSHPGGVTTQVDGLAASAASYIAMAGDAVNMAESSMMMIHNAWGVVVGNRNDMRQTAETLDKIDGQMAGIYAEKTGKPVDEIAGMMDAETWLTATEAKAAGFADAVTKAPAKDKAALAGSAESALAGGPALGDGTERCKTLAAALRAAFDPDGDGDDDAAEAIAAILAAQDSLGDALSALTGAPDAGDTSAAADARKQILARHLRIAIAQGK